MTLYTTEVSAQAVIPLLCSWRGTAEPEAALKTEEANVFEPACMTSFAGNVYVIQASEQLHFWARCVQKSL